MDPWWLAVIQASSGCPRQCFLALVERYSLQRTIRKYHWELNILFESVIYFTQWGRCLPHLYHIFFETLLPEATETLLVCFRRERVWHPAGAVRCQRRLPQLVWLLLVPLPVRFPGRVPSGFRGNCVRGCDRGCRCNSCCVSTWSATNQQPSKSFFFGCRLQLGPLS